MQEQRTQNHQVAPSGVALHVAAHPGSSFLLTNLQENAPEGVKMDPAAATQWCEDENGQRELSVVTWTKEKINQAVKTLVPDMKVWVIDLKPNQENSHTYALIEWRKGIPTFQRESLRMTCNVEAHLIQLNVPATSPETSSQAAPAEEATLAAPVAMIGPEFIAALGDFFEEMPEEQPNIH